MHLSKSSWSAGCHDVPSFLAEARERRTPIKVIYAGVQRGGSIDQIGRCLCVVYNITVAGRMSCRRRRCRNQNWRIRRGCACEVFKSAVRHVDTCGLTDAHILDVSLLKELEKFEELCDLSGKSE